MHKPSTEKEIVELLRSDELEEVYVKLDNALRHDIQLAHTQLKQFIGNSKSILLTKREAQRRIRQIIMILRKMDLKGLLVPENLVQFETDLAHVDKAVEGLRKHARTYSFCVKIFLNIFIHEAQTLKSINTEQIQDHLKLTKESFIQLEREMEQKFDEIQRELADISKYADGEVKRFYDTQVVIEENKLRTIRVQALADFILVYEQLCDKEKQAFRSVSAFMKHNKKAFKLLDEDARSAKAVESRKLISMAGTRELGLQASAGTLKNNFIEETKNFWLLWQPHVKLWECLQFMATAAIFTSLAVEFGVATGILAGFSRVFFGAKLSAGMFGVDHLKTSMFGIDNYKHLERLAEDFA